jgi:hypothetical protein
MLMECKHGSIYGAGQTAHSALALQDFRANAGSDIHRHADHYGLRSNDILSSKQAGLQEWTLALSKGPVLAEGNYGWARFGAGHHVILVTNVSRSGKLIYMNPNILAVLPHPGTKETYITIADIYRLRSPNSGFGGPFWQVATDFPSDPPPLLQLRDLGEVGWDNVTERLIRHIR